MTTELGRIQLNKKQKESVEFDAGDLLVKGVPGSGKSLVLMKRALRFNGKAIREGHKQKILIAVFTGSLAKYTDYLIKATGISPNMISVDKIDHIAFQLYLRLMNKRFVPLIKDDEKKAIISEALQAHYARTKQKHRFYSYDVEFWSDEFQWIKQKNIRSKQQYIDSERSGRGGKVRMTKADKSLAYDLFDEYIHIQSRTGKIEKEDYYQVLLRNKDRIKDEEKFDYVLLDEAQDLSSVQLQFAKILAKNSLTIAADAAQKIYNTSFSWKELGIDIRGRSSKTLESSFRSTKQIVQLATSLVEVNRKFYGEQEEYTEPVIPEREGSDPIIVACKDAAAEEDFVVNTIREFERQRQTIGVMYRSRTECNAISNWLRNAGIRYELIKNDGDWSMNTYGAKLSTFHSAKGLEFDAVIIPKFNDTVLPLHKVVAGADEAQLDEIVAKERSLLYVGMTRAKYDLLITYCGEPSRYLYDFETAYYEYISNDGSNLKKPDKKIYSETTNNIVRIQNGDVVTAHSPGKAKSRTFNIDIELYSVQKNWLGKCVGDEISIGSEKLVIDKIETGK